MPLITREVVNALHSGSNSSETLDLSTYGFFYGTFPTAPGVFVFATQYTIDIDLVSILISSLITHLLAIITILGC